MIQFLQLGLYLPELEPFQERNHLKVNRHFGPKGNGFGGDAEHIINFVRPDIIDGLSIVRPAS